MVKYPIMVTTLSNFVKKKFLANLANKCQYRNRLTLAISPIAISLAVLATVTFTDSARADVSRTTDSGCTNGGGQDVDGHTSCPSSPPQDQQTCNATLGNGKCPKGQNK
jgi:hypothetical protein